MEKKTKRTADPARKKRRVLILLGVLLLLGVLCALVLAFSEQIGAWILGLFPEKASSALPEYEFYDSNYTERQLARYAEYDRQVYYRVGGERVALTAEDAAPLGGAGAFFLSYFAALTSGDYETYNTFFSAAYYESQEPVSYFARQLVYDAEASLLSRDGDTFVYEVNYKLYLNNGTFRRDIGSGSSRPQIFTLTQTADGTFRIDRIVTVLPG